MKSSRAMVDHRQVALVSAGFTFTSPWASAYTGRATDGAIGGSRVTNPGSKRHAKIGPQKGNMIVN